MADALRKAYEDRILSLERAHELNLGALSRERGELDEKKKSVDDLAARCAREDSELADLRAALSSTQPQPEGAN